MDNQFIDSLNFRRENKKWLKYSSQIARRIVYFLKTNENMNQAQLARDLGKTPQWISKILSGTENFTLQTIANISEKIGYELIEFPAYPLQQQTFGVVAEIKTTGKRFVANEKNLIPAELAKVIHVSFTISADSYQSLDKNLVEQRSAAN